MPSFILKAAPDDDLYCEWSTVVDNVTSYGTARDYAAERVARADATGTSCKPEAFGNGYLFGGWSDEALMVRETETRQDAFCYSLRRDRLAEYLRLGVTTAAAEALLEPDDAFGFRWEDE